MFEKAITEVECTVPTWSLSYIINDDCSGISDEDKAAVDDLFKRVYDEHGEGGVWIAPDDVHGAKDYLSYNDVHDFGDMCVVVTYTIWEAEG